ncbi:MAG: flavodoxin family protein [bacterium]
MKILSIIGSYRKGMTIDTLVNKAIEGAKANNENVTVDKIYLIDKRIEYCKNCMVCRNDDPNKEIAKCVISDDLQKIYPIINKADGFIFGTPINCGTVTAVMKTFLERTCWIFAKPGKRLINGCPEPRATRKKKAIIILSAGIIPSILRRFCDDATSLIKSNCEFCFNAKVLGTLYAGAVEKKGLNTYLNKAYKLGAKLTS